MGTYYNVELNISQSPGESIDYGTGDLEWKIDEMIIFSFQPRGELEKKTFYFRHRLPSHDFQPTQEGHYVKFKFSPEANSNEPETEVTIFLTPKASSNQVALSVETIAKRNRTSEVPVDDVLAAIDDPPLEESSFARRVSENLQVKPLNLLERMRKKVKKNLPEKNGENEGTRLDSMNEQIHAIDHRHKVPKLKKRKRKARERRACSRTRSSGHSSPTEPAEKMSSSSIPDSRRSTSPVPTSRRPSSSTRASGMPISSVRTPSPVAASPRPSSPAGTSKTPISLVQANKVPSPTVSAERKSNSPIQADRMSSSPVRTERMPSSPVRANGMPSPSVPASGRPTSPIQADRMSSYPERMPSSPVQGNGMPNSLVRTPSPNEASRMFSPHVGTSRMSSSPVRVNGRSTSLNRRGFESAPPRERSESQEVVDRSPPRRDPSITCARRQSAEENGFAPEDLSPSRTACSSPTRSEREYEYARDYFLREQEDAPHRRLENLGASCYLNSCLQALSACRPFVARIKRLLRVAAHETENRWISRFEDQDSDVQLALSFLRIVANLSRRSEEPLRFGETDPALPDETQRNELEAHVLHFYIHHAERKNDGAYPTEVQQDTQEFLLAELNFIQTQIKKLASIDKKARIQYRQDPKNWPLSLEALSPTDVFEAEVRKIFKCAKCTSVWPGRHIEKRVVFPVPLQKGGCTEQLLKDTFNWTELDSNCKKKDCDSKKLYMAEKISKFPECMVIALGRNTEINEHHLKNTSHAVVKILMNLGELRTFPPFDDEEFNPRRQHIYRRMLGGAHEELSDEGVGFVGEVVHSTFYYEPLTDRVECQKRASYCGLVGKPFRSSVPPRERRPLGIRDPVTEKAVVKGDGNCFFRCISLWITGRERYHDALRLKLHEFQKRHAEMFGQFVNNADFEAHLKKSMRSGTFSSAIDLISMATLLNVTIFTFIDGRWLAYSPREHSSFEPIFKPATGAIYLENTNVHFSPVLNVGRFSESIEPLLFSMSSGKLRKHRRSGDRVKAVKFASSSTTSKKTKVHLKSRKASHERRKSKFKSIEKDVELRESSRKPKRRDDVVTGRTRKRRVSNGSIEGFDEMSREFRSEKSRQRLEDAAKGSTSLRDIDRSRDRETRAPSPEVAAPQERIDDSEARGPLTNESIDGFDETIRELRSEESTKRLEDAANGSTSLGDFDRSRYRETRASSPEEATPEERIDDSEAEGRFANESIDGFDETFREFRSEQSRQRLEDAAKGSTSLRDIDRSRDREARAPSPEEAAPQERIDDSEDELQEAIEDMIIEEGLMRETNEDIMYELCAVIRHIGDTYEHGHYVCYTKDKFGDRWTCCNDQLLYYLCEDRMLKKAREGGYVLFYTRRLD